MAIDARRSSIVVGLPAGRGACAAASSGPAGGPSTAVRGSRQVP